MSFRQVQRTFMLEGCIRCPAHRKVVGVVADS